MKVYDLLHLYSEYSIRDQGDELLGPLSHLHKTAHTAALSITSNLFGTLGEDAAEYLDRFQEFFSPSYGQVSTIVGVSNYHSKKHGPEFIGVSMVYPIMELRNVPFFNNQGIDIYLQTVLAPQTQRSSDILKETIKKSPDKLDQLPLNGKDIKFLFGAGVVMTDYKNCFHNNLAMFGPLEYPFLSIKPEYWWQSKKTLEPLRGDTFGAHAPIFLKVYKTILTNCEIISRKASTK